MEKLILLHSLTLEDFRAIFKEVIREEFATVKKELENKELDILLSRAEASELLKVNYTTLWNWTKKGK